MRTYICQGMLKFLRPPLAWCLLFVAMAAHSDSTSAKTAMQLSQVAKEVSGVSIFWLTSTGKYSLEGEEFKNASSPRLYRGCGGNCAFILAPVFQHLERAVTTKCVAGQQNVVIEIGNKASIIYSYSGRMIKVGQQCFFNEDSINKIIQRPSFIF